MKKKRLSQNKPKVNYRQSVERKKIERKLQDKEERVHMQVKKEERINKAVEGYSFRPQIEASEERLVAPTQALTKKKEVKYDKADKIPLSRVDGYTVNQLMTDMRFKLNVALEGAGLQHTNYAREVMLGMSKKPNP